MTMRPLDQQICFTMYATSMAITRAYKPMLDQLGLTYPQYLVVSVLGEADGLTIGGIATRLDLESSTVTPLVKRLEAAGLLNRTRDVVDERRVDVRLTREGWAVLENSKCLGDFLGERSGMSDKDLEALNKQVQALRHQIIKG
jgi:DNA-binding MarR family transcriptional regulator